MDNSILKRDIGMIIDDYIFSGEYLGDQDDLSLYYNRDSDDLWIIEIFPDRGGFNYLKQIN